MSLKTVGIIGTGRLGQHLCQMLLTRSQLPCQKQSPIYVIASSRTEDKDELLSRRFNNSLPLVRCNIDLAKKSDIIIIAVKPGQVKEVCEQIAPYLSSNTPIISVAAAVSLNKLRNCLPMTKTVIRCMPSIMCSIGNGMVAYYSNHSDIADNTVKYCFEPNETIPVRSDEAINLATVLVGSAPALFSWFGSQFTTINNSLPPDVQRRMIIKTMAGTADMLLSDTNSDEIIKDVASPQGITQGAIDNLNSECGPVDILAATYNKIDTL